MYELSGYFLGDCENKFVNQKNPASTFVFSGVHINGLVSFPAGQGQVKLGAGLFGSGVGFVAENSYGMSIGSTVELRLGIRSNTALNVEDDKKNTLGTASWMAIWWVLEVVDIAVTSLLPIVIFPLTGTLSISETTSQYGHNLVFLYLAGFIIAIAIERWGLHKRIALNIISFMGTKINFIISITPTCS